ncbi:hypothetical protein PV11_01142 [Exophiala sideris]|uniref:Uncharacterized protein n=1 Tax=Exophiala sideris TaxID=1016849 RepID=A0A0D1ZFB6_9EURO|nr:hypothetical protein PV11_01142 [Exophiala sideris]
MAASTDQMLPTAPQRTLQKTQGKAEEDNSKSVDLELGEVKSITACSEASTAKHVVDTPPVVYGHAAPKLSHSHASTKTTQKQLPEEKRSFGNFIKALQPEKGGHTFGLILLCAPTVLATIWPIVRIHMWWSLLEATMCIMVASTISVFWLCCAVLFTGDCLRFDDPSKLLIAIIVVQYGGLVLGLCCGVLMYWESSDKHHSR